MQKPRMFFVFMPGLRFMRDIILKIANHGDFWYNKKGEKQADYNFMRVIVGILFLLILAGALVMGAREDGRK
jgi:hypothetical protein